MTKTSTVPPEDDDIDLRMLGSALWRAKGWIVGLSILIAGLAFIALSMVRPLYTSEARVLVQNEETAFTRPTSEQGNNSFRTALDEQAVQSQVQVITSRDLILKVVQELKLTENPEFQRDAAGNFIERLLKTLKAGRSTPRTEEERAANTLAEHLQVYQLNGSSVIAIEYTSGSSQLAAEIANQLARVYIDWQRKAKIDQTKDATAWLDAQIKALRQATVESEEAAEAYKASEGLYSGSNNVALNAQQLSELNSQLILAQAQESEAKARAELINKMLKSNGDIDATPEVLNSQLVISLIEQRVQVQRQLAELSATLLPSHPRIQQLRSELSDVRGQIRTEAKKVVKGLENQAEIAAAREQSLRGSLAAAKDKSAGQSDAQVKLRALEREAKANRDLLESYLARYRDASSRHDVGAVPAQAAIISRAHAPVLPSFPKRGAITALVLAATALLSIGWVLAKAIIVSDAPSSRRSPSRKPRSDYDDDDDLDLEEEPAILSRAEMAAISQMGREHRKPPKTLRPQPKAPGQAPKSGGPAWAGDPVNPNVPAKTEKPDPGKTTPRRPQQTTDKERAVAAVAAAAAASAKAVKKDQLPKQLASQSPVQDAPAKKEQAPATDQTSETANTPSAEQTKPMTGTQAKTEASGEKAGGKSVWRPAKPAKRPAWLAVNEPRSKSVAEDPSSEAEGPKASPEDKCVSSTQEAKSEPVSPRKDAPATGEVTSTGAKTPGDLPNDKSTEPDSSSSESRANAATGALATLASLAATGVAAKKHSEADSKPAGTAAARSEDTSPADGPDAMTPPEEEREVPMGKESPLKSAMKPARQHTADIGSQRRPLFSDFASEQQSPSSNDTGPKGTNPSAAMDYIQRVRENAALKAQESEAETPASSGHGMIDRLLNRFSKNKTAVSVQGTDESQTGLPYATPETDPEGLSPNQLRHYLTQRISTPAAAAEEMAGKAEDDPMSLEPEFATVDNVLGYIMETTTGGLPRSILVAGTVTRSNSPNAAIEIARDLAGRNEQVVLMDIAKGSTVISGQLSMPRTPGFSDLAAGKADFSDVVKLDHSSTAQVIAAGAPTTEPGDLEPDNFMRVFEALTQTYECVVLHADMAAIEALMPALKFELPVAIAVLPDTGNLESEQKQLTLLQRLGCPVLTLGTRHKQKARRFSLFGGKVAI